MSRRTRLVAISGILAALSLGACSGGGDDTAESSAPAADSGAGSAEGGGAPNAAPEAAPSPAAPGGASNPATIPGEARKIRTAQVTVQVDKLESAATATRAAATALGGFVAAESTGLGAPVDTPTGWDDGSADDATRSVAGYTAQGEAALVLRVPEPKAEELLTTISRLGTPLSRTTSAEDVTGAVADLDSRVASQTRSVARVRALLDRATTLNDVVMLEGEVAKRESELEALQARRISLGDRADLATVTAILRLPHVEPAAAEEDDALGFLDGLEGGWTALVASIAVVLTILGALLPFAVVAALVLVPILVLRRRRKAPPAAQPPAAQPPAAQPPATQPTS